MNRRILVAPLAAAASSLLLLTGCTTGGAATSDTTATTAIRVSVDAPTTLDPSKGTTLPDFTLARASYDTLVRKSDAGLVGGLATSWTSTPTSATFKIRTDATCSDGTKITPKIVTDSLKYSFTNGVSTRQDIYGAANTPVITGDDAAGSVTITLQRPWPDLVGGLGIAAAGIICPAGLENPEALVAGTAKGAESGPYVLTAAKPGVSYSYKLRGDYGAWPTYKAPIAGKPATTVQYVVGSDSSAVSNLLIGGQLDIGRVFPQDLSRFEGQSGYTKASYPFGDFFLVFNERAGGVFADAATRKAVAQAVNVKTFMDVSADGQGFDAPWMVHPETACTVGEQPTVIAEDVPAASAVLKGVSIHMVSAQIVGPKGAGNTYIQEALRAAGAEVTLDNVDIGTWAGKIYGPPDSWDLTVYPALNFVGTMASPLSLLTSPSLAKGGGNPGAAVNDEAIAAFAAGLAETDDAARCTDFRTSAQALISRADAVPLMTESYIFMSRKGFTATLPGGALDDAVLRITQ